MYMYMYVYMHMYIYHIPHPYCIHIIYHIHTHTHNATHLFQFTRATANLHIQCLQERNESPTLCHPPPHTRYNTPDPVYQSDSNPHIHTHTHNATHLDILKSLHIQYLYSIYAIYTGCMQSTAIYTHILRQQSTYTYCMFTRATAIYTHTHTHIHTMQHAWPTLQERQQSTHTVRGGKDP